MIRLYIRRGDFKNFFYEIFYTISWLITRIFLRIFFGLEIHGVENIPLKGSFIFASNHRSYIDPPAIGSSVPRVMHFFAKAELFKPPLGFLITALNAFPVRRGEADLFAVKKSIDVLKNGGCILIFIEGRRQKTDKFGTPKRGTGFLVKKTGCGVVPVHIGGSLKFPYTKKITVKFGSPVYFSDEDEETISNIVFEHIKKLV